MATLTPTEAAVAAADMRVLQAEPGEYLCRVGRPVTFWFGLIDGLLKMSNDSALGMPITFTGVPPGGWFGEGTVLKHEPYRYNIQALRKSVVAGITVPTFDWLLDRSIAFNRFVMRQLNERLGQFIAAREIDRMSDPDVRVARSLGALFHPVLYPGRRPPAAHHANGTRLPGRAVAPAREPSTAHAAGRRRDPRRVRWRAGDRPRSAAPFRSAVDAPAWRASAAATGPRCRRNGEKRLIRSSHGGLGMGAGHPRPRRCRAP